jgi:FtsZ-binding cell division protein ZapB
MGAVDSQPRRVVQAERDAQEALGRLRQTSLSLLEANQSLARIPLLEFRAEEIWRERVRLAEENDGLRRERDELRERNVHIEDENARLEQDVAQAWERVRGFEESRSWRLLAPLRRLRAAFRHRG